MDTHSLARDRPFRCHRRRSAQMAWLALTWTSRGGAASLADRRYGSLLKRSRTVGAIL